jgi:(4-(4-[2-(gamma-L-glutamylamino)ethyl]phenoxymethyl)furan-2-yl)methanamine synthase
MSRTVLGLDIGGANLKAAHSAGRACLRPFELWKNPSHLSGALIDLFQTMPEFHILAVTMTGELCDCFETKRHGVNAILDAVESASQALTKRPTIKVWRTDGRFASLAEARATPLLAAAANWLALATFAGRFVPEGPALVIDVGSTTTDVVPLFAGKPIPRGRTDPERLKCGELVYTGVRRTPLCALLGPAVAAELFATTLDVYVILDQMPEDVADNATADGRPAMKEAARARLARMLCADPDSFGPDEAKELACQARGRQLAILRNAIERVSTSFPGPVQTVIVSGAGEFLARMAINDLGGGLIPRVVSLSEKLGAENSHAACAFAVAVLAEEEKSES